MTAAIETAASVARQGRQVLLVPLEVSPYEIAIRVGQRFGLDTDRLYGGKPEETDRYAFELAEGMPYQQNIKIAYRGSLAEIEEVTQAMKPDLLIVDCLQLMDIGKDSRVEDTTRNSHGLKRLAQKYKCAVLCLSKLSRPQKRVAYTPGMIERMNRFPGIALPVCRRGRARRSRPLLKRIDDALAFDGVLFLGNEPGVSQLLQASQAGSRVRFLENIRGRHLLAIPYRSACIGGPQRRTRLRRRVITGFGGPGLTQASSPLLVEADEFPLVAATLDAVVSLGLIVAANHAEVRVVFFTQEPSTFLLAPPVRFP